jgi:hypothetical protein
MILSFKEKFPWGDSTYFDLKILSPYVKEFSEYTPKLHTIREGNRWEPNMKLHMATGVRTKYYRQFNIAIEELKFVKSVQRIDILHRGFSELFNEPKAAIVYIDHKLFYSHVWYKDNENTWRCKAKGINWFNDFFVNDGFRCASDFWKWFQKPLRNGQLIHWTDLKY